MRIKKITSSEIGDMLPVITRKIPYINSGGCGIFAVYLYKELVKYGFKPSLLVFESNAIDKDDIRKYKKTYLPDLKNNRKNNTDPSHGAHSHYMVKLGNRALDCNGSFEIIKEKRFGVSCVEKYNHGVVYNILGTISLEDLEYLTKIEWAWNDCFDRENTEKIQKLIKKQLAKILN